MPLRYHFALFTMCRFFLAVLLAFIQTNTNAQLPKLSSYQSARATVLLDFDGQTVQGTAWNWEGTIRAKHSNLSNSDITEIFNRVSEDFRIFNINITTDAAVYSKAPAAKRVRIIFTPTHEWYGHAGGIAFVNSFAWGDETPAWVFTSLLDNNPKYIGEAASHEIGHTLGLQHQSSYDRNCELLNEYAEGRGEGETGWAPIMGVAYFKNLTTWTFGTSIEGCKIMQNDIAIISRGGNNIGMRSDDHGNNKNSATSLIVAQKNFEASGLINQAADVDMFKMQLQRKSRLTAVATPSNYGALNKVANIDLMMTLIKSNGDTILSADPSTDLAAVFDTVLLAGTYYIAVDGGQNEHVSDYGSVGLFTLMGRSEAVNPSLPVIISGSVKEKLHLLSWSPEDRESITRSYLEYSFNGVHYLPLSPVPLNTTQYTNQPVSSGNIYYRLRMILPDETSYYSNTVVLSNGSVSLLSTLINQSIQLNSSGYYTFQVYDQSGRMLQNGNIVPGLNTIPTGTLKPGLVLMNVQNKYERLAFKLVKQ